MNQQSHTDTPRYIRRPEPGPLRSTARRIRRGDDFAGDAWLDTTRTIIGDGWCAQTIVYTVVGFDPNHKKERTQ